MKDLARRYFNDVIAPSAAERRVRFEQARQALAEEARAKGYAPEVHARKRQALETAITSADWAFGWEEWIVATYLGDGAQLTGAERREAYERARKDLKSRREGGVAGDQRLSEAQYKTLSETFDWAIARLEIAYGRNASYGDRFYNWLTGAWASIDTRYKGLIAALQFVADFLKPMLELTSALAAVSGIGALLLLAFSRLAPENGAGARRAGVFCMAVFACSGGMMMAQKLVPHAQAQGVIGAVVPGASNLQQSMLASLGRLEGETKRIGDILEDAEKRKREEALEDQRQEAAERERQVKASRHKLLDAGYTLDAKGYLEAIADNYTYSLDYKQLDIAPQEADLRTALRTMRNPKRGNLVTLLGITTDFPFGRKVLAEVEAERARLTAAFPKSGAPAERAVACNPKSYAFGVNEKELTAICAKRDSREFLEAYAKLFSAIY